MTDLFSYLPYSSNIISQPHFTLLSSRYPIHIFPLISSHLFMSTNYLRTITTISLNQPNQNPRTPLVQRCRLAVYQTWKINSFLLRLSTFPFTPLSLLSSILSLLGTRNPTMQSSNSILIITFPFTPLSLLSSILSLLGTNPFTPLSLLSSILSLLGTRNPTMQSSNSILIISSKNHKQLLYPNSRPTTIIIQQHEHTCKNIKIMQLTHKRQT